MINKTQMYLFLLTAITVTFIVKVGSQNLACFDDKAVEPTIADIVATFLPASISNSTKEESHFAHSPLLTFIQSVASIRLPFRSLFSQAEFRIDFQNQTIFYFNDVYLIRRKTSLLGDICQRAPKIFGTWCSCHRFKDVAGHTQFVKDDWCVSSRPVCTSKSVGVSCVVPLDPFAHACIWVRDTFSPKANVDLGRYISYGLSSPSLLDGLKDYIILPENHQAGEVHEIFPINSALVRYILQSLTASLKMVPMLPLHVVMGLYLIYIAEDLAGNIFIQYSSSALFGALLFGAWVVYLAFSFASSIAKRHIPYFSVVVAPALATSSFLFSSFKDWRATSIGVLWAFWDFGLFGFPWLGKVCFITAMVVSVIVVHAFQLYSRHKDYIETPTTAERLLYLFISFLGTLLVFYGSSNILVSTVCVMAAFFWERIEYCSYRAHIFFSSRSSMCHLSGSFGSTTSSHKSGDISRSRELTSVTAREFDFIVADHTSKELEKLRRYVSKNRSKIQTKFASSKRTRGLNPLIGRFVDGDYAGVPYHGENSVEDSDGDDEEELSSRSPHFVRSLINDTVLRLFSILRGILFFLTAFFVGVLSIFFLLAQYRGGNTPAIHIG